MSLGLLWICSWTHKNPSSWCTCFRLSKDTCCDFQSRWPLPCQWKYFGLISHEPLVNVKFLHPVFKARSGVNTTLDTRYDGWVVWASEDCASQLLLPWASESPTKALKCLQVSQILFQCVTAESTVSFPPPGTAVSAVLRSNNLRGKTQVYSHTT